MEEWGIEFTAWPEMLAWPHFILNGWLPYRDIAIAHTPLLLVFLTGFYKLFGLGVVQLKVFTWLLIVVLETLLFYASKSLYGKKVAIITALVYPLLLVIYEGNGLWFDLFLTPFILLVYFFLKKKKFIHAGIFWTLAFLTKQTAFWFLIPIAIEILGDKKKIIKNTSGFIKGSFLVLAPFVIILFSLGILKEFLYWTVDFGIFYLPTAEGQIIFPTIKQLAVYIIPLIISLFTPGLIPWVIAGSMGVYPRWGLFHFQPALVFVALSYALSLQKKTFKIKNIVVFLLLLLTFVLFIKTVSRNWGKDTRFYEKDVEIVVENVFRRVDPGEHILVLNYWDSIYAYTNTIPAINPWVPYLSWYLDYDNIREDVMEDVVFEKPKTIVVAGRSYLNWDSMSNFINNSYKCVNMVSDIEICTLDDI